MHPRNSLESNIFSKKSDVTLYLNPVSFHGNCYEKKKGPGTSHQFLFSLSNMLRSFLSFVIHPRAIFDALIRKGARFIPKITIDNLCKPFHDAFFIIAY